MTASAEKQDLKEAPKAKKPRRTLLQLGTGRDRVRALQDSVRGRAEVKYRDGDGTSHVRTFANTKEGRAEAEAWATSYYNTRKAERARQAAIASGEASAKPPVTVGELWAEYKASPAFRNLRDTSRVNYSARFALWLAHMGADAIANETTLLDVDRFRVHAAKEAKIVLNSVRQTLNVVRIVYNWGQSRKLIATNDMALHRWKQPKELPDGVVAGYEPGEYSPDEMDRMIAELDYRRHDQWRGWAALMLGRHHGMRANAIRHLRVDDFRFAENVLHWDAKYQKQGKDVHQPITWAAYSVYLVTMYWREREAAAQAERVAGARVRGKNGQFEHDANVTRPTLTTADSPWLIFAQQHKDQPVSYTSLHHHLMKAEERAKVMHEKYRAVHGLRRGRVGEVIDATGDRLLGLESVGDTDVKMLKSYDKRRQERINAAFAETEGKR